MKDDSLQRNFLKLVQSCSWMKLDIYFDWNLLAGTVRIYNNIDDIPNTVMGATAATH